MAKSPQEKKRLSSQKDRRNTYGENSKSSRKNIARNKRIRARVERRTANAPLRAQAEDITPEDLDRDFEKATMNRKRSWKKTADEPLGVVLERKRRKRSRK